MRCSSLKECYNGPEIEVIEKCNSCGICIENCPVFHVSAIKDKKPEDVAEKMMSLIKDGVFSEEAYMRAFSCMNCGYCIDICPQGINPLDLNQVARNKLASLGKKSPEGLNFLSPQEKFSMDVVLSSIQMKPSEVRWLREAPPMPEHKDIVLFLGCYDPAIPHRTFAILDVFEKMNIDFVAVGGGGLCCGICQLYEGDLKSAEECARKWLRNMKAFSPAKVIITCPHCYSTFRNIYPKFLSFDFEVQFYTQFLSDNLDKIEFRDFSKKRVTLHEACPLSHVVKDHKSARNIIQAMPGLELIEMEHTKENSLCCGCFAHATYPEYGMDICQQVLEDAKRTGADLLVNLCPFCSVIMYAFEKSYPVEVTDIITFLSEKKYENKLRKYWRCQDVNQIVEMARGYIEESSFTIEEMKEILPHIFEGL